MFCIQWYHYYFSMSIRFLNIHILSAEKRWKNYSAVHISVEKHGNNTDFGVFIDLNMINGFINQTIAYRISIHWKEVEKSFCNPDLS